MIVGGQHLYIIQMDRTGVVKIGRSSDVDRRIGELQTSCPYELRIVLILEDQGHREREFHRRLRRFSTRRFKGEWFEEDGLSLLPDTIYEQFDLDQLTWWEKSRAS